MRKGFPMQRHSILALCLLFTTHGTAVHAQAGLESYDLTPYRVISVHDDWRVLCTPVGTGSWSYPRDCAVEDRYGLIVFVNPFGYFAYTRRGHVPGDGMMREGEGFGAEEVLLTYAGPDTSAEFISGGAVFPDGSAHTVSLDGYAEAQAAAIALMQ
jgi:hypothetical protein